MTIDIEINSCYNHLMDREPYIKGLNEIFRMGYMPIRDKQLYGGYSFYTNCAGHAFAQLTNELLDKLDKRVQELGLNDFDYFFGNPYGGFSKVSVEDAVNGVLHFWRKTGLEIEVEPVRTELKFNQYRVAVYYSQAYITGQGEKDLHFTFQERDGSWSSKEGGGEVEFLPNLEESLPFRSNNRYILHKILKVTNPYAKEEKTSSGLILTANENRSNIVELNR